jgi:hypothetical protein
MKPLLVPRRLRRAPAPRRVDPHRDWLPPPVPTRSHPGGARRLARGHRSRGLEPSMAGAGAEGDVAELADAGLQSARRLCTVAEGCAAHGLPACDAAPRLAQHAGGDASGPAGRRVLSTARLRRCR